VKRVFVDSGGFFALLVNADHFHPHAVQLFTAARADRWSLLTTNCVVVETYALLLNRVRNGRVPAIRFLDLVERGLCEVERVTEADEQFASDLVHAHEDKNYSLCDALSFAVTERLHISEVIAFDRHFRDYGKLVIL
jgi:predicted nucleic acid-binding protein